MVQHQYSGLDSEVVNICPQPPLAPDVDLEAIALDHKANNYSGADLQALVREAAVFALKVRRRTAVRHLVCCQ